MSDEKKRKPQVVETPKRGDAAWQAAKQAIASRNDKARKLGRERRQKQYEQHAAEQRAAEKRERAALAKLWP